MLLSVDSQYGLEDSKFQVRMKYDLSMKLYHVVNIFCGRKIFINYQAGSSMKCHTSPPPNPARPMGQGMLSCYNIGLQSTTFWRLFKLPCMGTSGSHFRFSSQVC